MEFNYLVIVLSILMSLIKRYMSKISAFCVSQLFSFKTGELLNLKATLLELRRERDSYNQVD
jgi:hypothetical protein